MCQFLPPLSIYAAHYCHSVPFLFNISNLPSLEQFLFSRGPANIIKFPFGVSIISASYCLGFKRYIFVNAPLNLN